MRDFKPAFDAAREHARAEFPKESCGLIVNGEYIACDNLAPAASEHQDDPMCRCQLCAFVISNKVYLHYGDSIEMVLHSHPNGPLYPSEADMVAQVASAVPWGIIALDDSRTGEPLIWGDRNNIPPIIGRSFMHGVTDCFDIVRDVYALGRVELEKQGITGWPFDPIELPAWPRVESWWKIDTLDYYNTEPVKHGFEEISISQARPGDVFLCKINSDKFNHAGVLLANSLILHHLPMRLSRREPAGIWARQAGRWLRYVGAGK